MIQHFLEASNGGLWGKFLLLRHSPENLALKSSLPDFENETLLRGRKFDDEMTMMVDLQTGTGAIYTLSNPFDALFSLESKRRIWVCPLYRPTLFWLAQQGLGRGKGDITKLPRYIDVSEAEAQYLEMLHVGKAPVPNYVYESR